MPKKTPSAKLITSEMPTLNRVQGRYWPIMVSTVVPGVVTDWPKSPCTRAIR
jgi:hypothetical protein